MADSNKLNGKENMQKSKKGIHRKIVKYIQKRNNELLNDEYIGAGRFRIDLFNEKWKRYCDNSGYYVSFIIKISDTLTGNKALFMCNNYNYIWVIFEFANDFLIRCSSGHTGSFPPLDYIAYDVHEIIKYAGEERLGGNNSDEVIGTWNWTNYEY